MDLPTGSKGPKSTSLLLEDEAVLVVFRRHTLLPLDDCLYALQATIPHLTRSSLHRGLQRHGISCKGKKHKFKTYPVGYFHIDIAEVRTAGGAEARSSPSPSCMRRPPGGLRLLERGEIFWARAFGWRPLATTIDRRLIKPKHPWTKWSDRAEPHHQ
jgi:hypothetical protein